MVEPEIVQAVALARARDSAAQVCAVAGRIGPQLAEQSLEAIVTGAIAGALASMPRRRVYDTVQRLADRVAGSIADDVRERAEQEKGSGK